MAVRICIEIGHEASLRTKKTQEGFTHDWEVFVRGCDGAEIHYYIEKVVFYLHETFPKPKRVVKEPPYSVKESGYAGFNLPIDIYLRNNNEPKKIRFNYDLHLQQSGPPIIKVQKEKYVFNSVNDEFKMKLLKGGATIGSSSSMQDASDNRSSNDDKNQMTNKPKLSGSDMKKQKIKIGEPCRDFQELFGSPINMSKSSEPKLTVTKPESKAVEKSRTKHSPHKDSHKDKEKSKDKTDSEKKNRDEKKKDRSKDHERSKERSTKKSPRPKSPSPKRSSSPRFSSPPVLKKESKHNDKEKRDKNEERKSKKEKRSKEHKENKHGDGEQKVDDHKDSKIKSDSKKESTKKSENPANSPTHRFPETEKKKDKPKEKSSSKEDRYSEKYKHKKKDKEKREKKEEKSYKSEKKSEKIPTETKPNLFKSEPPAKKEKAYVSPVRATVDDESSNSSTTSSNSSLVEKKVKNEAVKVKEEKNQKLKKEKGYQENTIKCKRKSDSADVEEPPEKIHKEHGINNNSDLEQESKPVLPTPTEEEEDYFGLLRDLQHKIMGLKDNSDLQKVVKLIAETGRYEVSAHTFDFDLCLLDRSTVQQLQDFFASET
ncbi:protein AF-9 isoform X1 [Tribolium madens]|uniref:protein AF-9 isoform X1 n=1 Tax=Tribolium madens TaxID=41895 RepID=UPI001CF754A1|nr:protein AF-9 isoform X1 [Tribolium madens]